MEDNNTTEHVRLYDLPLEIRLHIMNMLRHLVILKYARRIDCIGMEVEMMEIGMNRGDLSPFYKYFTTYYINCFTQYGNMSNIGYSTVMDQNNEHPTEAFCRWLIGVKTKHKLEETRAVVSKMRKKYFKKHLLCLYDVLL